ncbi:MAG: Omp28-related outer membrane protein [Sphingobacteriales bacterium]|jgi:thiol-disulfide isomerase/thioredoxin|nr:Omp28-related outer membrane protein [Sphingobacteriales bacterium]MBP9141380.1 Omp28-related outer membrane protein [Chitinophagales bacterium]MDA0198096.1 Omp28-related outer membrane protein [Bacteroidota bacterium]MBK6890165.1 Omp28-related outer membrane protein [Sphingobacteriales bacterium]MBK7527309.1 Omp28-related outer membrane protein [Sphingobacteriales bacterium]
MFKKIFPIIISFFAIFALIAFTTILPGCGDEKGPYINFDPDTGDGGNNGGKFEKIFKDTTFIGQIPIDTPDKVVLIEEFTGFKCPNCPKGAEVIAQLEDQYPNKIAAISIHAGFFAENPNIGNGDPEFRTPEGNYLNDALLLPEGYPSAAIDRLNQDGQLTNPNYNSWGGVVMPRLSTTPPAFVHTYSTYDSITRLLTAYVQVRFKETVADPVQISLTLTESGMVANQTQPDNSIKTDYVHKHVLRKMLTNAEGTPLSASDQTAGRIVVRKFTYTLPNTFNAKNCHLVAFAHYNGATKEVIQAANGHIGE